jgi:hypothetical protein
MPKDFSDEVHISAAAAIRARLPLLEAALGELAL